MEIADYTHRAAMAVTPGFTAFVAEQLDGCGDVSTKRMFGGVGVYCGDVFFAIIDNDILYLKVDDTTRADYVRAGCGPFKPYGDDRETMGYYNVPVSVLEDAEELVRWAKKAIGVARSARERATASEPRERSAPAKRRARERVGESEGRSPSDKVNRLRRLRADPLPRRRR